jgi:hypothetical protein
MMLKQNQSIQKQPKRNLKVINGSVKIVALALNIIIRFAQNVVNLTASYGQVIVCDL